MDSQQPSVSARSLIDVLTALSRGPTRYDVEGELARGGMGTIHRVWDRDLRRHLAMKVYPGDSEVSEGASRDSAVDPRLARFVEEAQITGQLDHPGIVPVHELGLDEEGQLFFTMRLVRGKTLGEVFDLVRAGDSQWTEMRVLRALVRVCEAVAFAHSRGVVHRDLKPANVMVGPFGEVYVMDWGLAKVLGQEEHPSRPRAAGSERVQTDRVEHAAATPDSDQLTLDGNVLGTPSYMPPEQAEGRLSDVGPHSDVYAIGAILYEFLAGHAPYASSADPTSVHAVLESLLAGPPASLTSVAPDAPEELVAICDKAMAREIADRHGDTMELADELSRFFERPVTHARGVLQHSKLVTGLQWVFGFLFWSMLVGLLLVFGVLVFSQATDGANVGVDVPIRFRILEPSFTFAAGESWIDDVQIHRMEGDLTVQSQHKPAVLAMTIVAFGALAFLLYIVHQTRHILRTLRRGEPFARSNMKRMRRIGGAMFLLGALKSVHVPAATVFLDALVQIEGLEWSNHWELAYTELLVGILIFVLAEVFKVGAELEQRASPTGGRSSM